MKKSVFIVDREPRCYSQLHKKLIAKHYDVFHAATLQDAREHLEVRSADLLLIDLDGPGEKIPEELAKLAKINSTARIIGVTERREGRELPVREELDGVAEKPFAVGNLIAFVDELLTNASARNGFRYVAQRMPDLHLSAPNRPYRALDYPAAYSGWGINE